MGYGWDSQFYIPGSGSSLIYEQFNDHFTYRLYNAPIGSVYQLRVVSWSGDTRNDIVVVMKTSANGYSLVMHTVFKTAYVFTWSTAISNYASW